MAFPLPPSLFPLPFPSSPEKERPLSPVPARAPVFAPSGVVATSQPLASQAGVEIMRRGGNAFDAAVAAAAMLNVVEPYMTGIGGDMFALCWSAREKRLVGINGSGRAGSLMTRARLLERGHAAMPAHGAEAVTVPGALAGWAALLQRFGTRSLAEVLEPAIGAAEHGFAVTPIIAFEWAAAGGTLEGPAARSTFLVDGKRAPAPGERFRNPEMARTFRAIAANGPGALYDGDLGRSLLGWLQSAGGFLTPEDLKRHTADWVEPLSARFGDYRLWELPPNGQGIAALEMVRILENANLAEMGHNSVGYLHHLIEAKKLAFADLERYVGDPGAMDEAPAYLLSDEFVAHRRKALDPARASRHAEPGPGSTNSETIYLAAADEWGNMVSFICSVYDRFGSGVVVPGTGFVLQNRGSGFTLDPGLPNTVAPGKRPRHTIIPAFVTRSTGAGEVPWMSFGVMGGAMQPQGHIQVLLNMLVFGMDPQQAIDAPRFRHMQGLEVVLEEAIPAEVRAGLCALGHQATLPPPDVPQMFGGGQAIVRLPRGYQAGSDSRKDGLAAGY